MHGFRGTLVGADKHRPVDAARGFDTGNGENFPESSELFRLIASLNRAGQMMQRQHRMGFAAAEIGLQADHRVAACAGKTGDRGGQHTF